MTSVNARRRCYDDDPALHVRGRRACAVRLWLAACSGGGPMPQAAGWTGASASSPAREAVKIREFNDLPKYYDYYSAAAVAPGPQKTRYG